MNITSLLNFSALGQWAGKSTTVAAAIDPSPLAQAVQRAEQRLASEVESNSAQLSSLGRLKSALSDLQTAAQAALQLPQPPDELGLTDSERAATRSALNALVSSFNATLTSARASGRLDGEPAATDSARRVTENLGNALGPDLSDALHDLGLTLREQGDATGWLKAREMPPGVHHANQHSALVRLAERIDTVAGEELQSGGQVSDSFGQLMRRARTLDAQRSALESAAQATATDVTALSRKGGLAAYLAHSDSKT